MPILFSFPVPANSPVFRIDFTINASSAGADNPLILPDYNPVIVRWIKMEMQQSGRYVKIG